VKMTPKTESYNNHSIDRVSGSPSLPAQNPLTKAKSLAAPADADYFELLSAYIDGEATPEERRRVNQWLDNDPEVKSLYLHLLRIRQNLQQMPVPQSSKSTAETVEQFFWLLDQRRRRTMLKMGGGAIAALFMAALSGLVPGVPSVTQLAKFSDSKVESQQLMIALNRPIVPIPKAAVAVPLDQLQYPLSADDDTKEKE
jgi:anti-sigma factor RsiW